jgi:hypothetical protein
MHDIVIRGVPPLCNILRGLARRRGDSCSLHKAEPQSTTRAGLCRRWGTEIAPEFRVLTITLGYLLPAFCETIPPLLRRAVANYDMVG